jgi:hypothetical protein
VANILQVYSVLYFVIIAIGLNVRNKHSGTEEKGWSLGLGNLNSGTEEKGWSLGLGNLE